MTRLTLALLATLSFASFLYDTAATTTEATYQEYMSLMNAKMVLRNLQRTREKRQRIQGSHCQLFPLNLTVTTQEGCAGNIPYFGCAGRCRTTEIPHHYYSR